MVYESHFLDRLILGPSADPSVVWLVGLDLDLVVWYGVCCGFAFGFEFAMYVSGLAIEVLMLDKFRAIQSAPGVKFEQRSPGAWAMAAIGEEFRRDWVQRLKGGEGCWGRVGYQEM